MTERVSAQSSNIPVFDFSNYYGCEAAARQQFADEIGAACEDVGFFVIANHGVAQSLVDHAFAVSAALFALPLEEKMRMAPVDGKTPRGYQAFATRNLGRTLGQPTPPDLREQFFIGPLQSKDAVLARAAPFYADNIWPAALPEYREAFTAYYRALESLSAELMRVFALALKLPVQFFDDKIQDHFSTCPSNFYPPLDYVPPPGQLRTGAHTDFGSLTILAMAGETSGLQVLMPDNTWLNVDPPPGHFVVNLGDMMARWTNDRWKSTLHRVANIADTHGKVAARQSIGYFLHPNYEASVACLETCCDAMNPAKYAPIVAGEHMREKLRRRVEE